MLALFAKRWLSMGVAKAVRDYCCGTQFLEKRWSKAFFDTYL